MSIDTVVFLVLLRKSEMHLRVVRLKLDTGERIVGVRFPELLIPLAERELTEQKALELMLQKQMVGEGFYLNFCSLL